MTAPLYGLILCGGNSSRLGQAKHLILKEKKELYIWWQTHLQKYCNEVYISCRKDQVSTINSKAIIIDQSQNCGPLEGIYQAFNFSGSVDWLVVAVDLVYMNDKSLELLIENSHDPYDAVAFRNPETGGAFPLCSIYRKPAFEAIKSNYFNEIKSPRLALQTMNTFLVELTDPKYLKGINTLQDFELWNSGNS